MEAAPPIFGVGSIQARAEKCILHFRHVRHPWRPKKKRRI